MNVASESFFETEKLVQHRVAKGALRRCGLHSLDPFDRIDLVRAVFALTFLDSVRKGAQHLYRENHQPDVERRRRQKRTASTGL